MSNVFIKSDGGYAQSGLKVRKKIGNCVPVAIAHALNKEYIVVWNNLFDLGKVHGYFPNQVWEIYLKQLGWKKMKPQRTPSGRLRKLKHFQCKNMTALVRTRKHLVCVKDGKILDTWNSGRYKACSYYIKEK
jgi:hypothetical protein